MQNYYRRRCGGTTEDTIKGFRIVLCMVETPKTSLKGNCNVNISNKSTHLYFQVISVHKSMLGNSFLNAVTISRCDKN